ncbi:hypothetical protein [Curtobacterium sp. MCJR17_043]|uniref:hypothetical protein n=1 Tax=Curtobacterium sp. MCJR17_043 TaxID=2175660 RepID=UPI0024E02B3B|nr:hypothetical protein [Curtobacterium sp. MCJR17_043]WIB36467.1 hypothetical protein DEJ15_04890 [Curtobacterium sp. MCJR17_043]
MDETKTVTFDAFAPALSFTRDGVSTPLFADDYAIRVNRPASTTNAKVLLLHLHNAVGDQAEVLTANAVQPTLALRSGSKASVGGSWKVGRTITAKPGEWNASGVTFTYQWSRGGTAIPGATKATYTTTTKDVGQRLTVTVTAKKSGYTSGTTTALSGRIYK